MGAGEASTDEKTAKNVENSAKQRFWRQNEPLRLKIQILNSKFEFQACWCITNLKHYICGAPVEYGRWGGLHRRENSEKQRKTLSVFGAKTTVTAQNSNF